MEVLNLRGKEFTNDILGVSLTCYKDCNDKVWFIGSQVAEILGYSNTRQAIITRVDADEKILIIPHAVRPHSNAWLVDESGIYSLIFGSNIQKAKDFRKWVTNDILPSIREQVFYALPGVLDTVKAIDISDIDQAEFRKESKFKSNPEKVGLEVQEKIRRIDEEHKIKEDRISELESIIHGRLIS